MEKLIELVSLQDQVKCLRLQDKLGKQNFHGDMKKVFELITDYVKQTAQETIGAPEDTARATELKGEETNNAINKMGDSIKYAINFDLRLTEPLSEVANSKITSQFRLQVNLFSKKFYITKNVSIAFHGKSLAFIGSNEKSDLEGDILELMTNQNFNALSI